MNGVPVKKTCIAAMLGTLFVFPAHAEDNWKPVEEIKTYAIAGSTGPELYNSIGERGPKIGGRTRVIAHTSYVLRWDRTFDRSNNACTVVSATPKLKITYTLPRPSQKLATPVRENWQTFHDGIYRHERVHGETARETAREIVRLTVGLSVPNDPKCQKIRKELARLITEQVKVQHMRDRDFDRVEMGNGGNVQQLVLALVNGG